MYTITKAIFTMRGVELVGKKEFAFIAFDLDDKTFIIHVAFLTHSNLNLEVHLFWRAILKADKTPISIFLKYADFANIFSKI